MIPGLAWASLLLRAAGRDGVRNAWLWIVPLLAAQQIADLERRPWVTYIIPFFGLLLGSALNGRGVTPSGARLGESPALLVPIHPRARVAGAVAAGAVVSGIVSLAAFAVGQAGLELVDLASGGPDTYAADPVRGLREALICVLALLPTIALRASVPPALGAPWLEGIVLALIAAGVYFDTPSILRSPPVLMAVSSLLCAAIVATAPLLERRALRHASRGSQPARRASPADRPASAFGAPPRTPAQALLRMHAATSLFVTSAMTLALLALTAVVFFLSSDPSVLPFLLPMAATLGVALFPTLPLAVDERGGLTYSASPALRLPVRPRTLWWTSLVAACAQLAIALAAASLGTAALSLVVPVVSAASLVIRILSGVPMCAAAVLLLRAGLHLGPLMPTWARVGCLAVGAFAAIAAPVEIGLPRSVHGEHRLELSAVFLLATVAVLVALTPGRGRRFRLRPSVGAPPT